MNEKTKENIIASKINIHSGNWFICLSKTKTLVIGYNGCASGNIPHFWERENGPAWLESLFPLLQTELGKLMEMSWHIKQQSEFIKVKYPRSSLLTVLMKKTIQIQVFL